MFQQVMNIISHYALPNMTVCSFASSKHRACHNYVVSCLIQADELLIQADELLILADELLIQADELLIQADELWRGRRGGGENLSF